MRAHRAVRQSLPQQGPKRSPPAPAAPPDRRTALGAELARIQATAGNAAAVRAVHAIQRAAGEPAGSSPAEGPVTLHHEDLELITPRPGMLYRGDSRSPEEIKKAGGFESQGTNHDQMLRHLLGLIGDDKSGWISLTGPVLV